MLRALLIKNVELFVSRFLFRLNSKTKSVTVKSAFA